MNYYYEILSRLKTACSCSEVASAASVLTADWSGAHVFDGGKEYIGAMNRGRVPFVVITRLNSDYSFDALSTGDSGGQLDSRWNIKVVVGKSSRSDEATNEAQAYDIAQKIIKNARLNYNLAVGNQTILPPETHPFGLAINIDLSIQNTHSDSEK